MGRSADVDAMTETHDPYLHCEDTCSHDLARGASAEDFRDSDGPYPDTHPFDTTDAALSRWLTQRLAESPTR